MAIPGRPPDLLDPPEACRFAAALPVRRDATRCATHMPELREIRPGHFVRSEHPASERVAAPRQEVHRMSDATAPSSSVRNLVKQFPIKRGLLFERTVDQVNAVVDVSFDISRGTTLGLVGESGLGQVHDRLLRPAGASADERLGHLRRGRI